MNQRGVISSILKIQCVDVLVEVKKTSALND